ncbi:hypothetical protein REC12_25395 [Desulfosporosinus sp. PR]|uniref:phage tail terminator family protein n=1 Tax=Candidatus Desulfosporosinus nitrosoreducens TaxID=3401928 RepID=UPI0027FC5129|nr:hypothetical protein [Desulfosporosinus sp. PR]MDQ7096935.1 hypothetical protein [Desulfosporosinus sp. PR]
MIGYVDVKRSIIDVLKRKAGTVKVVANEEMSGFKPPAFFVQIMPINDTPYRDYEEKLLTVNIHYFSAEKTDLANLKMLDQLNLAFFNVLKIGDRVITLQNKRHQISDNVLQFKFDLEFLNDLEAEEINNNWVMMTEIDESLGYSEGTVELMQELEIEEE